MINYILKIYIYNKQLINQCYAYVLSLHNDTATDDLIDDLVANFLMAYPTHLFYFFFNLSKYPLRSFLSCFCTIFFIAVPLLNSWSNWTILTSFWSIWKKILYKSWTFLLIVYEILFRQIHFILLFWKDWIAFTLFSWRLRAIYPAISKSASFCFANLSEFFFKYWKALLTIDDFVTFYNLELKKRCLAAS